MRVGVHLDEGVVLGDNCHLGQHAVVLGGVKIYPHKVVEAGATVTSSIVWESKGSRSLFSGKGVSGLANVDLSPELAVRVAMAYATMLPKGSTVTTSRDSSRAARMLKRAAMIGLNAAGLDVEDLEAATVPITRFHVRSGKSQGGVTVRLDPDDPQSVVIRFLDADGNDVDEATQRKIERMYYREESRRVLAAEIGDIEFPPRTPELYTAALLEGVDLDAIRRVRFKLVLDYAYGTASLAMPSVLGKLGVDVLVVNPLVSTPGVLAFERDSHAARIAGLVISSGAHLGAVISPDGEDLTLIDDRGRILSNVESLMVFVDLVAGACPSARIDVPVSASDAVAGLAESLGASVDFVTLASPRPGADKPDQSPAADLAANGEGGFAFPEFLPAYDAIATLVRLLELLATADRSLSEVVTSAPKSYVVHEELTTPFEMKGTVMRSILEMSRDEEVVLVDGVKRLGPDGWTLIAPDRHRPITHVYGEGRDDAASRILVDRALDEIRSILGR